MTQDRNIIYQYWQGDMKPGVQESVRLMKEYAERIGAFHRFDHNRILASKTCSIPIYYEPANPLIDPSFNEYDNVALVDIDVFPVDGLSENLFDQIGNADVAICTEPQQPHFRQVLNVAGITNATDNRWVQILKEKWGINYSFDDEMRPMVYNTGVVILSKSGIQKIRKHWPSFQDYIVVMQQHGFPKFYKLFQDYFSAFIHHEKTTFTTMHNGWNSYIHKLGSHPNATVNDTRTNDTKLVHIMFRTADDWPKDALYQITNLPQSEWKDLPVWPEWPNDPKSHITLKNGILT